MNRSDPSDFNYPLLRQFLSTCRAEFERAARERPFLFHQLLFSPRDPLPDEAWMQFAEANKVRHLDGLWEDWYVSPSGLCCGHLYGRIEWFDRFDELAKQGWNAVAILNRLVADGEDVPVGTSLNLPDTDGIDGWLDLLYGTAAIAAKELSIRGSYWRIPDNTADAEDLMYGSWSLRDQPRDAYPNHPHYWTLGQDLFAASATAIRIWFSPDDFPSAGDCQGDTPITLPEAGAPHTQENGGVRTNITQIRSTFDRSSKPRYDKQSRSLYLDGKVIKRYTQPSVYEPPGNQEMLLISLEREGWPDDPVMNPLHKSCGENDSKRVLIQAVYDFNKYQDGVGGRLRLKTDADGVTWHLI